MTMPHHLHLGYTAAEQAQSPYASFYRETLSPLPEHVKEALLTGGQAAALFPSVTKAVDLLQPGYWPLETGFGLGADGSIQVFVLTTMPGVTPAMWDWWFAWHGSDAQRYKLWHPRAHISAQWADGRSDLNHYIGRTSRVVEYVGPELLNLTIRFVAPATLGLDEERLQRQGEVAVCARGGIAGTPMETGWLIHHVRPTESGCEMRSRFWLGGNNVRPRGMHNAVGKFLGGLAAYFNPLRASQGADLLVHCAQEMNHLADFLPALYAQWGPRQTA